jgi:hypothetical protein
VYFTTAIYDGIWCHFRSFMVAVGVVLEVFMMAVGVVLDSHV